jgi:hypothetical protein
MGKEGSGGWGFRLKGVQEDNPDRSCRGASQQGAQGVSVAVWHGSFMCASRFLLQHAHAPSVPQLTRGRVLDCGVLDLPVAPHGGVAHALRLRLAQQLRLQHPHGVAGRVGGALRHRRHLHLTLDSGGGRGGRGEHGGSAQQKAGQLAGQQSSLVAMPQAHLRHHQARAAVFVVHGRVDARGKHVLVELGVDAGGHQRAVLGRQGVLACARVPREAKIVSLRGAAREGVDRQPPRAWRKQQEGSETTGVGCPPGDTRLVDSSPVSLMS